jgi:hypothetical protein
VVQVEVRAEVPVSANSMTGRNGAGTSTAVPPPRSMSPFQQLGERLPRSRRQRRPGMVAAGAVLIGGFATVAAGLVARSDHSVSVLAVARPVAVGQVLSPADLRVARISGSGLSAMSASSLSLVVGETATSSLTPGMLLQSSMLTRSPVPGAGLQAVAVAEKSSLVPAGVAAGRSVSLIQVPTAGGGHTAGGGGVLVDRALVVAVRTDPTGGTTVLSVEVPASLAPTVAQSVAAGALAVTLLPVAP